MVPRRGYRGGGGGQRYFGNLTFNTESKSAIFEFSGEGGYFGNLTFNTESKSAICEFRGGGGGYFGVNFSDLISQVSDNFHFRGGGGYFGVNVCRVLWRFWTKKCPTGNVCCTTDSLPTDRWRRLISGESVYGAAGPDPPVKERG